MQTRWHIDNRKNMMEFPNDETGLKDAIEFRKNNPEFKGRHIRNVIQSYPSQIPFHVMIKMNA